VPSTPANLQLLIDILSDAFLCATPDGKVLGCNEAACRLFGYTREELTALHREDLRVAGDPTLPRFVANREKQGAARGRLMLRAKGGKPLEVEVVSVAVPTPQGPQIWIALHDLAEQRRADEATAALCESNEMLRALTDAAFEGVLVHRDGVLLMANHAAEIIAGVPRGGLVGKKVFDFIAPASVDLVRSKIAAGDEQPYETFGRRADGSTFPVEVGVRLAPVQVGGAPARVVALRDLTARKQLEEEFRQAQKMEAIGRLAGGVAHDFNNMLVVILSGIELAAENLEPSHTARLELDEIKRAALRAKELTRDLLALSHKQLLNVRVVEVGAVMQNMRSMIGRLIGEDIELIVEAQRFGIRAQLDPAQLEIMLMNLIVNARDAMPTGGRLVLEAAVVPFEVVKAAGNDLQPGPQVRIVVADTGTGMDEGTKARMFEPFFTTKGLGRGTGLGLSTVFGIVKQSGGTIAVDSTPGRGSTFSIYFPSTSEPVATDPSVPPKATAEGRRGTVLVVEDELPVRRSVVLSLRSGGYDVLEAPRPDAAIELARTYEGRIDLLVTDVVMPGMSGRALSEKILAARPDLRVLFVSGYTEDAIVHRGVLDAGVHFLQKPFSGSGLLEAVAKVLR
jgi:two-component system cell cycle sensor histidine kinase/response regulator CckA